MKRGFTLVELLVVVGIIGVVISIVLPTVLRSQRHAQAAAGTASMRSMAQVLSMYTQNNGDAFLNPFGGGADFTDAVSLRDPERVWDFNASPCEICHTEAFAYYWYSYLGELDGAPMYREEQFSPADGWMKDLQKTMGKRAETREGRMLWPSSFLYSPTFFSDSGRYPGGDRLFATASNIRTQYAQSVAYPSSKVILFERMDFDQRDRLTLVDGNSRKQGRPPAWNNIRSKTAAATVDGSVRDVDMAEVYAANLGAGGLAVGADKPGLMRPEGGLDLPHGAGTGSDGEYPAYFWATRDGIEGRDLPN